MFWTPSKDKEVVLIPVGTPLLLWGRRLSLAVPVPGGRASTCRVQGYGLILFAASQCLVEDDRLCLFFFLFMI